MRPSNSAAAALVFVIFFAGCKGGEMYSTMTYTRCDVSVTTWGQITIDLPVPDGGVAELCIDSKACLTTSDCLPSLSAQNPFLCVRGQVTGNHFAIDANGPDGRCMSSCEVSSVGTTCEMPYGTYCANVDAVGFAGTLCVPY